MLWLLSASLKGMGVGGRQKTEGSIQSSDQKHNLLNRNTEKLASQFTTHWIMKSLLWISISTSMQITENKVNFIYSHMKVVGKHFQVFTGIVRKKYSVMPDMVVYICNLSTWEAEAGGWLGLWEQPGFHSKVPLHPGIPKLGDTKTGGEGVYGTNSSLNNIRQADMFSTFVCIYVCVHKTEAYMCVCIFPCPNSKAEFLERLMILPIHVCVSTSN